MQFCALVLFSKTTKKSLHCWPEQIVKSSIFSKKQLFKNRCGLCPGPPPERQQVHRPLINVTLKNECSYNFVRPVRPGWHLASLKSPTCALTGHNMRKIRKLTSDRTNFASHPVKLATFLIGNLRVGRWSCGPRQIFSSPMADSCTLPRIFRGYQFLLSVLIHTHKVMTIVNTSSPALRCAYILFLNRDSKHLGLRLKLILSKVQEKRFGQVD